jgi:hypothetical protein
MRPSKTESNQLTISEFEVTCDSLACRLCGHVGLVAVVNVSNGGTRPGCPSCGCSTPLKGIQWLRRQDANTRKLRRPSGDPSTEDVWQANGDCCFFCGKTGQECKELGIGTTIQHGVPFVEPGGPESPLVPFCSRCQQASLAAQEEIRAHRDSRTRLMDIIERLREKQRLLDEEREG